jgi:hypothetical protein
MGLIKPEIKEKGEMTIERRIIGSYLNYPMYLIFPAFSIKQSVRRM